MLIKNLNRLVIGFLILSQSAMQSSSPQSESQTRGDPSTSSDSPKIAVNTAGEKVYLIHSFDIRTNHLDPGFAGNDIEAIIKAIKDAPELQPKSEFESTQQFSGRRYAFSSREFYPGLNSSSTFAFIVGEFEGTAIHYDADSKTLRAELSGAIQPFVAEGRDWDSVIMRTDYSPDETYIASNAYGAKVELQRHLQ